MRLLRAVPDYRSSFHCREAAVVCFCNEAVFITAPYFGCVFVTACNTCSRQGNYFFIDYLMLLRKNCDKFSHYSVLNLQGADGGNYESKQMLLYKLYVILMLIYRRGFGIVSNSVRCR